MTREEILAMPAGRELDALVAEKVMGWAVTPYNPDYHIQYTDEHGNPYGMQMSEFEPSTNISAAWEVEAKLRTLNWWIHIQVTGDLWYGVQFWNCKTGELPETVHFNTAPEAICKAALLAVMEGQSHDL